MAGSRQGSRHENIGDLNVPPVGARAALERLPAGAATGAATGWRAATDNVASWVKLINGTGNASYQFGSGTGNILVRVDNWTANTAACSSVSPSMRAR